MNEEVENNKEKKKQIRLAIIGVVALLLLTLVATFAFFLIDTDNSTSKSQINADIEAIDSIALQKVTENLHVNLNAADMAEANKNTEYYGDDTASYVKTLEEGMHNLGKLTATGGNGKTRYMCTANAVITMQVATENDMGKFFNTGDAYLYLNAGSLQQRIDLSELKTSGTRTIPFEIGITSESEKILDGYVEIINSSADQTYLANKTLNIDVTFQDLDCDIGTSEVETYLRSKDADKKLTTNLVNGLYRYQGNSIVNSVDTHNYTVERTETMNNNYICLGSDCSTAEGHDMYRIIGVTEDGLMKVIKNTPANESIAWNSDDETDINWPQSELYKYLNTDFYQTLPIKLKNKILNTTWLYGNASMDELSDYLLSDPRAIELREKLESESDELVKKEAATELAELMSTGLVDLESKNATNKIVGNISLMNMTDYCSSFENEICMNTTEDPNDFVMSWLAPQREWNEEEDGNEWMMTRQEECGLFCYAWYVDEYSFGSAAMGMKYIARPVFFLTSDIELSGEGTIDTPFRVAGIE